MSVTKKEYPLHTRESVIVLVKLFWKWFMGLSALIPLLLTWEQLKNVYKDTRRLGVRPDTFLAAEHVIVFGLVLRPGLASHMLVKRVSNFR